MSEKHEGSEQEIHSLLQRRWSPRAFDQERSVARDDLLSCLEAARWAPSCFNDQPWRFVVCRREDHAQAWQDMLSCLSAKNQTWAQHAPVLLMVCANTLFGHDGNENRWAEYDAGAASVSLCLQAASLGLATHQMGGFNATLAAEKFHVPEAFTPMTIMAVGYQGEAGQLDEALQAIESEPRKRKTLAETVCFERWQDT